MRRDEPGWQAAVDELAEALVRKFPDPVDLFEDELAARLGLGRHPACPRAAWRKVRVRFLNSME